MGKEAENPTKRDGRGGGLLGAVCGCDLDGSDCPASDLTERPEVVLLSLGRFASSKEASEVRWVVSNGDLSGRGIAKVRSLSSSSITLSFLTTPLVWLLTVVKFASSAGASCSACESVTGPVEDGCDWVDFWFPAGVESLASSKVS